MDTGRLTEALLDPEAYLRRPESVELIETRISLVFLAGDRVYKVKKPVRVDFVDYSTLDKRYHFCAEEVRLNRDLARDVYLGVVPITGDPPRISRPGHALDYAVEMVRLPEERMLSRLLEREDAEPDAAERIADLLKDFHGRAATGAGVDRYGRPDAVLDTVLANLEDARPFLPPFVHARLESYVRGFVDAHRDLLLERARSGRIREGHGDLHAGNICLRDDGIVIYDRIEFAEHLRCCDVASDVALLAMDLERRGHPKMASTLVQRYGDPAFDHLMTFYKAHRAAVRGTIGYLRAAQQGTGHESAADTYALAAGYTLPPVLVLTCGLQGSGKSTVACNLARPLRAALLRSDPLRKKLAGMQPTDHWDGGFLDGPYAPGMTRRTYTQLLKETGRRLAKGRSVIVDATFGRREWRERFQDLARRKKSPFAVVYASIDEEVVRRRLKQRLKDPHEVSDADYQVFLKTRATFEAPLELARSERVEHTASTSQEELTADLLEKLIRQA